MRQQELAVLISRIQKNEVQELELFMVDISDADAAALAEALKANHRVKELCLWHNKIGEAGAAVLVEVLMQPNCSIQALRLCCNKIGDAGVAALAGALMQPNCSIQVLELEDDKIGDAGVAALAGALQANSSVHTLNLKGNQIGEAGAAALAEALMQPNCSIQVLDLQDNKIGDAGCVALAGALQANSSVHTLNLCSNQIAPTGGGAALAEALQANRSVQELRVWEDIGVDQKIKEELKTNLFLNSLPTLGEAPRDFLEYPKWCSTLRDIYFQTRAKYDISMSGQSSESVPNKISCFLDELEGEMLGTYGAFEVQLADSQDATTEKKKTAFRATSDMLECLLKPGQPPLLPLVRCIRYLRGEEETTMDITPLPLLSYRLLLEAAAEVKAGLPPALQEFVATLLLQKEYHSETAGQLMAIPEVMSCLGMAPVIISGAEVVSLDGDDTQPVLIDCYVREDSQPVVLQAAIITEGSLVPSNPGLADLSMFDSSSASSDKKEEEPPKP